MKTFKDAAGHEWRIALTLGKAMEIRDRLKIDLLKPEDEKGQALTRIGTDEYLLAQVIEVFLEEQFDANGVTAENMRDSFDGATILAAQTAFYEELADFFLSRGRSDRAKAVQKQQVVIEKATAAASAKIESLDLDAMVGREMEKAEADATRGAMSGESPAPSE